MIIIFQLDYNHLEFNSIFLLNALKIRCFIRFTLQIFYI
jgi:hypothetical protein